MAPDAIFLPRPVGAHGRVRMTETQARVAANALVFSYFGALEQWYLDGGIHPDREIRGSLLPLRSIWSKRKPGEPDS